MKQGRVDIVGLDEVELVRLAGSLGEPPYRGRQLYGWLYTKKARSFDEMSNLPKSLRDGLTEKSEITRLQAVRRRESADGTTKFLFSLADGLQIESVLIPGGRSSEGERLTLCASTQVGCPLDCAFCATASMGFARNLTAGEIVNQVFSAGELSEKRITNIVFMGMGEPLMNYEGLVKATEILMKGALFGPSRITVSTAGWVDGIRRMADEGRKFRLAVSLHSGVDSTREKLMPVSKRYPIRTLTESLEYYYRKTKRRLTFEQVFFDGVNDTDYEVRTLVKIARRIPSKINVIPFHSIGFTDPKGFSAGLRPSARLDAIVEYLRTERIPVFVRSSSGRDIEAACGQLAVTLRRKDGGRGRSVGTESRLPKRRAMNHRKKSRTTRS